MGVKRGRWSRGGRINKHIRVCDLVARWANIGEIVSDTLLKHISLNGRGAIKIGVNQDKLT